MKNNIEEYVEEIKGDLRLDNLPKLANQIDEAILKGATGTEIWLLIRGELKQIILHPNLSKKTRKIITDTLSFIDNGLKK